jgi:hypothetical protein
MAVSPPGRPRGGALEALMIRERIVVRRPTLSPRQRVSLTVVERYQARCFVSEDRPNRPAPVRRLGALDYVCGSCGHLLAVGVTPGFAEALLVCACGAVNQVPHDCAHA